MAIRCVLVFIALSVFASEPAIILGVLEEVAGHYAGAPATRAVRVVFQKKGNDWQAFPNSCSNQNCLNTVVSAYPKMIHWTIGFSGRSLGQAVGVTPQEYENYSDVGLQGTKGPIPTIGKRSAGYGGFQGSAVLRPLIANSQP